jgi:polysaccharide biosynthesis/export protein
MAGGGEFTLLRATIALFLFIMAIVSASCSNSHLTGVPPSFFASTFPKKQTTVEPGDSLSIRFYYTPELNENVLVRQDGKISLPLFQGLFVAGLSPDELQAKLVELYTREFKDPVVTVHIDKRATSMVYVTGEVQNGGPKPLVTRTTVGQLLAQSAIVIKRSSLRSVILIRRESENSCKAYKIDADFEDGKERDIYLEPGDIVFVPRNIVTVLGDFVQTNIRDLVPPAMTMSAGFNWDLVNQSPNH